MALLALKSAQTAGLQACAPEGRVASSHPSLPLLLTGGGGTGGGGGGGEEREGAKEGRTCCSSG